MLSAYVVPYAAATIIAGQLCDAHGPRRVLRVALVLAAVLTLGASAGPLAGGLAGDLVGWQLAYCCSVCCTRPAWWRCPHRPPVGPRSSAPTESA